MHSPVSHFCCCCMKTVPQTNETLFTHLHFLFCLRLTLVLSVFFLPVEHPSCFHTLSHFLLPPLTPSVSWDVSCCTGSTRAHTHSTQYSTCIGIYIASPWVGLCSMSLRTGTDSCVIVDVKPLKTRLRLVLCDGVETCALLNPAPWESWKLRM